MPYVIERVDAVSTRQLRQDVLRGGGAATQPLQDDDDPAMWAFGAIDEATGALAGCCLIVPREPPVELRELVPEVSASWRLRGVAVRPEHRGGLGRALLAEALGSVAERGGGVLWCYARVAARGLYRRAGLAELGPEFDEVGHTHVLMWRLVGREL